MAAARGPFSLRACDSGAVKRSLPIDKTDMVTLPFFVATMLAEAKVLRERSELRELGDLDDWTPQQLSDTSPPPDPLIPVGYEPRDTKASLTMVAGNIALNLAWAGVVGRASRAIFGRRDRKCRPGQGRICGLHGDVGLPLLLEPPVATREAAPSGRIMSCHHSSEHYNLSTALRQPWAGIMLSWVYWPMPLVGFTPAQTAKASQLNLLYQYWIHTEAIDRMAPAVEATLNTPSHHRVHHGANPQYLDKNYGGILILWGPAIRHVRARGPAASNMA